MGARIIGYGKALPRLEVVNDDLADLVATNDEWISSRTGICSRHIAITETALDLGRAASQAALGIMDPSEELTVSGASLGPIDATSIDLLVLTTITPDVLVPSNAAALKAELGLDHAIAFDINAACTGFIYGLSIAESMMAASQGGAIHAAGRNPIRRALVVSSERLSRLTDWQDRNTCVLFGDGAGAVVLEWNDDDAGVLATYLKNDDDETNSLTCLHSFDSLLPFDEKGVVVDRAAKDAHDEAFPDPKAKEYSYIHSLDICPDPAKGAVLAHFDITDKDVPNAPQQTIYMDGQRVFKFAAKAMEAAVREVLARAGKNLEDVTAIIPHQANKRIIEFAAKRLGLGLEAFQLSIQNTGNTSSSGVPMALTDAFCSGKIGPGDLIVLVAFGGGLTSGAALIQL